MLRCLLLILFSLQVFLPNDLVAQVEDHHVNKQLWLDYNPSFALGPKYTLYSSAGIRTISLDQFWLRLYLSTGVQYKKSELWEFHGGLRLYYTFNKIPFDVFEVRPFQGVRLNWPNFKRLPLRHFVRLEERLYIPISGDFNYAFRLLYQLDTKWRWRRDTFVRYFYVPAIAEGFLNTNEKVNLYNNVFRLTSGMGYVIDGSWSVELNFLLQRTHIVINKELDTSELVFRLRVYHKISSGKGNLEELFKEEN